MTAVEGVSPRVFLSYMHELDVIGPRHRDRALRLAHGLRKKGVNTTEYQFVEHESAALPEWELQEVRDADFVLCLASPSYKQRLDEPADEVTETLLSYIQANLGKFISVVLPQCSSKDIPAVLLPAMLRYYTFPEDQFPLYCRLTGQPLPEAIPRALGPIIRVNEQRFDDYFNDMTDD